MNNENDNTTAEIVISEATWNELSKVVCCYIELRDTHFAGALAARQKAFLEGDFAKENAISERLDAERAKYTNASSSLCFLNVSWARFVAVNGKKNTNANA